MQPDDTHQIKQLHALALDACGAMADSGVWDSDLDDIQASYIDDGGEFLVGEYDGLIITMGAFRRINERTIEIKRMRTHPTWWGQGLGRMVLSRLEQSAVARGYKRSQLDTTIVQSAAQSLYECAGYREVRRETEGWPIETIFYEKDLA